MQSMFDVHVHVCFTAAILAARGGTPIINHLHPETDIEITIPVLFFFDCLRCRSRYFSYNTSVPC